MRAKERLFRFKRFSVCHERSAMKVGVDSVLLGCWAELPPACLEAQSVRVLDVGAGCGLLSLMMAQRFGNAIVEGVEVERGAFEEAAANFVRSPWAGRLRAVEADFGDYRREAESTGQEPFDLLISNPPYFNSGMESGSSARSLARHEGGLSAEALVAAAPGLLVHGGALAVVVPSAGAVGVERRAAGCGLSLWRKTLVRGHGEAPPKRAMLEFVKGPVPSGGPLVDDLVLELSPGVPTPEHRELCRDFYLRF